MADLTKTTVNLLPKAVRSLRRVQDRNGCNATDAINRALLVYDLILALQDECGGRLTLLHEDGTRERVTIL